MHHGVPLPRNQLITNQPTTQPNLNLYIAERRANSSPNNTCAYLVPLGFVLLMSDLSSLEVSAICTKPNAIQPTNRILPTLDFQSSYQVSMVECKNHVIRV